MAKALVNAAMLGWALDRADVSVGGLATKLNVQPEQVDSWLSGRDRPTFVQAQKTATILAVPFGYLYLQKPPADEIPIPDLRTVGGELKPIDLNLRSLLTDILFKQDWFRDFLEQNDTEPLPFVGSCDIATPPVTIAQDIQTTLLGKEGRPRTGNFEGYLQALMQAAEDAGIWVMRTGIVGNNTHRPLAVRTFRGLAIADKISPLVLINGQDSKAAQIFTFVHELAHIWLGSTGISNVQLQAEDYGAHRAIERHCNAVAAEFLVPAAELRQVWRANLGLLAQVDHLSQRFKVSRVVVARRAFDLGFIAGDDYAQFFATEQRRWQDVNRDSGGDFYKTLPVRNGRRFTKSVVAEAMRGTLLLREASSLLGIQPGKIREMHERLAS